MTEHHDKISELKLIPSTAGVLTVSLNDEVLFSKIELGRYPEKQEIEDILTKKLS